MADIEELVSVIGETQQYFKLQVSKQVDTALTLRNWLFGYYITEYELNGADRAEYGAKLFKEITKRLERNGFKQIRERHLYLCKDFYLVYPDILRSLTAKSYLHGFQDNAILRSVTTKLKSTAFSNDGISRHTEIPIHEPLTGKMLTESDKLINHLSFTHIIELIKADTTKKKEFLRNRSDQK